MQLRLFKSKYNLLKHASPAKPRKRFASFCIDFILVFICSILLFSLGSKVTESMTQYRNSYNAYMSEIEYYNDLIVETHLVNAGDERESYYDYFSYVANENVYRAINLNYKVKNHEDYSDYIISDDIAKYGVANKENDNLAYFYLEYVPNNVESIYSLYGEQSASQYLKRLYEESFEENYAIMFYDNDEDEIPVLKTEVAYYIWYYIENSDDSNETMISKGSDYYNTFQNAYSSMLEAAEKLVYTSEPYYSTHYIIYEESVYTCARMMNITLLICIVLSALLVVMLPKFLFKDEVTIGRRIMGLGVVNIDNTQTKKYVFLVKSIVTSVFFYVASILINFQNLLYPLSRSNKFTFGILVLLLFMIALVNSCCCLFTHSKQTLLDIVCKTKVVDLSRIDEGDLDEPSEAMPY